MSPGATRDLRLARTAAKSLVTRLARVLVSPTLTPSERAVAQARLLTARELVEQLRRQLNGARAA